MGTEGGMEGGGDGFSEGLSWKLGRVRVEVGDSPCRTGRVFRMEGAGEGGWF